MKSSNTPSLFTGTWRLLADRSEYEMGEAPTAGVYIVESEGEDLFITINWTDSCGHGHSVRYGITPDGKEYAYERPEIADAVMARFAGERSLETITYKNGRMTMYAERRVSEDGRKMVITQKGYMPDGQEYSNVQYYERVQ